MVAYAGHVLEAVDNQCNMLRRSCRLHLTLEKTNETAVAPTPSTKQVILAAEGSCVTLGAVPYLSPLLLAQQGPYPVDVPRQDSELRDGGIEWRRPQRRMTLDRRAARSTPTNQMPAPLIGTPSLGPGPFGWACSSGRRRVSIWWDQNTGGGVGSTRGSAVRHCGFPAREMHRILASSYIVVSS